MWCTNRLLWHTNSDSYGIRTPTFTPYEPFLLGVGVVFNILNPVPILTGLDPSPELDKIMHLWVQTFCPLLWLGSGEGVLGQFQTPVLYWMHVSLLLKEPQGQGWWGDKAAVENLFSFFIALHFTAPKASFFFLA